MAMRCGRRDSNPLADSQFEGPDEWRQEKDGTRTCSFCGSLHEDDFIDILEHYVAGDAGYHYDGTTKDYKRYANRPGLRNANDGGLKFYGWHVTDANKQKLNELDRRARHKSIQPSLSEISKSVGGRHA